MSAESKREKIAEFSLAQARRYKADCEWGRSYPHYLVVGQLKPEQFRQQHLEDFLTVVGAFSLELERDGKQNKVLQVYEQATEVLPDHPKLLTNYASVLFKQGKTKPAEKLLRKVLALDPDYLLAKDRLENLASSLLDRWHFPMLNDSVRNNKFRKAIENKVKNGCETVLDIGTGTGLLSLYAAKAGARSVYACESNEVMAITAKEVFHVNNEMVNCDIRRNGMSMSNGESSMNGTNTSSRIKLIRKLSLDLNNTDVPEPINLLVTETVDAGLLGEHILTSVHHAWQNQLQCPSPTNPMAFPSCVLPGSADFYVVPISCPHIQSSNTFTRSKHGYLDMNRVNSSPSDEPYSSEDLDSIPGGYQLLAQPRKLFTVDFQDRRQVELLVVEGNQKNLDFKVTKDGECHAFAAWFTLQLDENEHLSTAPKVIDARSGGALNDKTCWQQAIFPITSPKSKVYRGTSEIKTAFKIHKHVELISYNVETSEHSAVNGNGCATNGDMNQQVLRLPPASISWLNCEKLEQVAQWLAYYAARDVCCTNVLDLTAADVAPLFSLQLAKTCTQAAARFTLLMDTAGSGARSRVSCLLDFLTAVSSANQLPLDRFSFITELPETTSEKFNICFVNPVQPSGRLDQSVMLSLPHTLTYLVPNSGLILPHKLQLWAQVIESFELCDWTHLSSNDPVGGFRIADQINILAVTHQQDLKYSNLNKTVLSEPFQIRDIDLTKPNMEREFITANVKVVQAGKAHAVIYWFVLEYGWNLYLSTLESKAFSQCAVMCKETSVEKDENLQVAVQSEEGLLYFHVKKQS